MKTKIILLYGFFIFLTSCSKDESLNDSRMDDIKIFKNVEEFQKTFELLNSFKNHSDFERWSLEQNFNSLYNCEEYKFEDEIPFKLSLILNKNKEFIIGNKIISFSNGVIYENQIDELGKIIDKKKVIGTATVTKKSQSQNNYENHNSSRMTVNASGGEWKEDWTEFNRVKYAVGCSSPTNKSLRYRLVQYLVVENYAVPGMLTQCDLIFKLRMSQFHNGSWVYNNTSTERLFSFNISGNYFIKSKFTGQIAPGASSGNFSLFDSNNCSNPLKGTKSYVLGTYSIVTGMDISNFIFDVGVNGYLFHKVNGDINEVNKSINW